MGAFGTAFTLATHINVLPMVIYTEFTLEANIAMAAALSFVLGADHLGRCWRCRARPPAAPSRRRAEDEPMRNRGSLFYAQLAFTLLVCAFLIVPVVLSMLAGLTENYFGRHRRAASRCAGSARCGAAIATRSSCRSASRSPASPCTLRARRPHRLRAGQATDGAGARAGGAAGAAGGGAGPRDRAGADPDLRRLPATSAPPGCSSWSATCCSRCRSWCARCWRC